MAFRPAALPELHVARAAPHRWAASRRSAFHVKQRGFARRVARRAPPDPPGAASPPPRGRPAFHV